MEDNPAALATTGPRTELVREELLFNDNGSGVSKIVLFVLLFIVNVY